MGRHKPHQKIKNHQHNEGPFTLNRHSAYDLSLLLISNSRNRGPNLSSLQKTALKHYHESAIFDFRKNHNYTRIEILKAYFLFFDSLFFFGSLQSRCGLRFRFRKAEEVPLSGMTGTFSKQARIFGMFSGDSRVRVEITIYLMGREGRGRKEALEEYQGTLLHEMIHAFLSCWACDYKGCTDAKDVVGKGHGPIWQDIAYALEQTARDQRGLSMDLRLGRPGALATEVHETGRWPNKSELARWAISEKEFSDAYQVIEDIGGSRAAKKIAGEEKLWGL